MWCKMSFFHEYLVGRGFHFTVRHSYRNLWLSHSVSAKQHTPISFSLGKVNFSIGTKLKEQESVPFLAEFSDPLKIMQQFIMQNNFSQAERTLQNLISQSVGLDRHFFNVLLESLAKQDVIEMKKYFEEMKRLNIEPNVTTYNALMKGFGLCGEHETMLKCFEEMKSLNIKPTAKSFSVLMSAFGSYGKKELMLKYFQEMKQFNIKPTASNFDVMMYSLGKHGDLEDMIKVYNEMKQLKIRPTSDCFFSLIKWLSKKGDTDRALFYYKEMRSFSVMPNANHFYYLLSAFGRKGDTEKMLSLIDDARQIKVKPNIQLLGLLNQYFPHYSVTYSETSNDNVHR